MNARQLKDLLAATKKRYGAGWKLLSADQQEAAWCRAVLSVINLQELEQYKPAQKMIQSAWDFFDENWEYR